MNRILKECKIKLIIEQTTKAEKESEGIALLFL
jgi:hypothetical protein